MARRSLSPRKRIASLRYPIRGPRVELVVSTSRHLSQVIRLLQEPSVARWTLHVPFPYRVRDGREWLRRSAKGRRTGRSLGLTVLRRSDGVVMGGVGLHHIEEDGSCGELGYWLGREYRGQGYAAEAIQLIMEVGFRKLGIHRVEALIFPSNLASRRVARRCGFRYEGRLRDEVWKVDHWQSTLLYARLAGDPPVGR